jgi:hypothetical protein
VRPVLPGIRFECGSARGKMHAQPVLSACQASHHQRRP